MGDYVDRGMESVEVIAYLFARKVKYPKKLYLLRGNHETQEINTWVQQYRRRSFLAQCIIKFGVNKGRRLCYEINKTFEHMPFGATIDNEIFCVHGGIPKREETLSKLGITNRIEQINQIPCPINVQSPGTFNYDSEDDDLNQQNDDDDEFEEQDPDELRDLKFDTNDNAINICIGSSSTSARNDSDVINDNKNHMLVNSGSKNRNKSPETKAQLEKYYQRLAFNLLWADPANDDQEKQLIMEDNEFMVGRRGEFSLVYGTKAVETFLKETGLSMIMRAHEATQQGVKLCKHAQVMTIFSTSKNHGRVGASCACVFVDLEKIYVINKSVAGDMSRSFSNLMDEDDDEFGNNDVSVETEETNSYKNLTDMKVVEEVDDEEEEEKEIEDSLENGEVAAIKNYDNRGTQISLSSAETSESL